MNSPAQFPTQPTEVDYTLGIGDQLMYTQLDEFVTSATQFPAQLIEEDYLLGVGDELTLIQLNEVAGDLGNIISNIPQNDNDATYAQKIDKIESKINWELEARKIIAKINAFHPNPGSWFELKKSRIKVIKAIEVNAKGEPGEIINKNFTIACYHNAVQILELKKEGKNKITAEEFLKGNKLEVGSNIYKDV